MQGKPLLLAEQQVGDHPEGGPVGLFLLHPAHPHQDQADHHLRDKTSFQHQHLPIQSVFPSGSHLLPLSTLFNPTQSESMALWLKVLVPPWKIANMLNRIHHRHTKQMVLYVVITLSYILQFTLSAVEFYHHKI